MLSFTSSCQFDVQLQLMRRHQEKRSKACLALHTNYMIWICDKRIPSFHLMSRNIEEARVAFILSPVRHIKLYNLHSLPIDFLLRQRIPMIVGMQVSILRRRVVNQSRTVKSCSGCESSAAACPACTEGPRLDDFHRITVNSL